MKIDQGKVIKDFYLRRRIVLSRWRTTPFQTFNQRPFSTLPHRLFSNRTIQSSLCFVFRITQMVIWTYQSSRNSRPFWELRGDTFVPPRSTEWLVSHFCQTITRLDDKMQSSSNKNLWPTKRDNKKHSTTKVPKDMPQANKLFQNRQTQGDKIPASWFSEEPNKGLLEVHLYINISPDQPTKVRETIIVTLCES